MSVLLLGDFEMKQLINKIESVETSFWAIVCQKRDILIFGKEFATGLGFTNSRKALNDHVDDEDVTTIRDVFGKDYRLTLKQYFQEGNESLPSEFFQNLHPSQKLLNRRAIVALCLGSKLPGIKPFRRWIYNVIDQVMETGSYSISSHLQHLSLKENPVEKIKSTFKDIPNFEFGGDNTEREEMASTFKEGKDLSKHLGKSRGGTIGGTERDRRDKSRIKLLVKIYKSEDLQNKKLKEKLEKIVLSQKLLEIKF